MGLSRTHSSTSIDTRFFSLAAGLIVLAGALISLYGWFGGVERAKDWEGNGITIKFNTAVCLALLALALCFAPRLPSVRIVVWVLAGLAALIGLATLFEHITTRDLGIDNLVFTEPVGVRGTTSPNRMGIPGSAAIALLGIALLLTAVERGRWLAARIAVAVACIPLLSLTGYVYGADELYSLPRTTAIALQTSSMLLVLAVGITLAVPEFGIVAALRRDDAGGKLLRAMLPPAVATPLLIGWLRLHGEQLGFYDAAFGTAMRTLIEVLLFGGLIWWTARSISRAEEQTAAAARSNAENEAYRLVAEAQEAERKRLSMELHDHVGQQITALRMTLQPRCEGKQDGAELQAEIAKTCDTLKRLDDEVSLLAWQLRPSVLDEFGLNSALQSFGKEWSERHGIQLECDVSRQTAELPPAVETAIFRIVQEALNNVAKHSAASRVDVTLGHRDHHVMLVIEDNGRGFENDDRSGLAASGLGLAGMRERTALMGGTFEIESGPGTGTTIYVRVPVAEH